MFVEILARYIHLTYTSDYSWRVEKAVEKALKAIFLVFTFHVEGGIPGSVCGCGYGCVTDRPSDKC